MLKTGLVEWCLSLFTAADTYFNSFKHSIPSILSVKVSPAIPPRELHSSEVSITSNFSFFFFFFYNNSVINDKEYMYIAIG